MKMSMTQFQTSDPGKAMLIERTNMIAVHAKAVKATYSRITDLRQTQTGSNIDKTFSQPEQGNCRLNMLTGQNGFSGHAKLNYQQNIRQFRALRKHQQLHNEDKD